jgi:hypothetical protein
MDFWEKSLFFLFSQWHNSKPEEAFSFGTRKRLPQVCAFEESLPKSRGRLFASLIFHVQKGASCKSFLHSPF